MSDGGEALGEKGSWGRDLEEEVEEAGGASKKEAEQGWGIGGRGREGLGLMVQL